MPNESPQGESLPSGANAVSRMVGTTLGFLGLLGGLMIAIWLTPRELSREQYVALNYYPLEEPRAIEPFALTNHRGEAFTEEDLKGEWSLLFFGYTYCPDICPTTLALLSMVARDLTAEGYRNQPRVVLISVDPERDTVEKLANYVTFFNEAFVGLTGTHQAITGLAQQLYVPFGKVPGTAEGEYLVDHGANIIVVNPAGEYAGFLRTPHEREKIVKVVESLLRN